MNRRAIALAAAILFVLSWAFPIGAGLVRNPTSLPQWWGTVDVALAFVVAVGAFGIQWLGHGNVDKRAERTTYRIYRSSLHALLVMGVLSCWQAIGSSGRIARRAFSGVRGYSCTFSRRGLLPQALEKFPTRCGAPATELKVSSRGVRKSEGFRLVPIPKPVEEQRSTSRALLHLALLLAVRLYRSTPSLHSQKMS